MHSSRLAALKPLPEPPKQPKCVAQQAIKMIIKAASCSTTKEKNDILNNLQELWPSAIEEFDAVMKTNQEKVAQYQEIEKQYQQIQKDFSTLKQNSDFFKLADSHKIKHPRDKYLQMNYDIEKEIMTYEQIPDLAKFSERFKEKSKLSEDRITFILQDEVIKHLEMLAYQLKKRMIAVEQSQEISDDICAEFGSLNGLLTQEQELVKENKELKQEESVYIKDPMAKRRRFDEFSSNSARSIISSLSEIVETELEIAERFKTPQEIHNGDDIDTFCNITPGSLKINFSSSEFPSLFPQVKEKELTPEEAFDSFKSSTDELNKYIDKLMQEKCNVKTGRSLKSTDSSAISSRINKMTDLNNSLFDKISNINVSIDNSNEDIEKLKKELSDIILQRKRNYEEYYSILTQYRSLVDKYISVQNIFKRNKTIVQTLLSLSVSIGYDMFQPKDDILKKLLLPKIQKEVENTEQPHPLPGTKPPIQLILPKPAPAPQPLISSELSSGQSSQRSSGRSKGGLHHRKKKHSRNPLKSASSTANSTTSVLSTISSSPSDDHLPKPKFFKHKVEILNAMAYALQIGGFVLDMENKVHNKQKRFFDTIIHDVYDNTKTNIYAYMQFLNQNIGQLRILSNSILVKEKVNFALQTDPYKRSDVEIQTEEIVKKAGSVKKH